MGCKLCYVHGSRQCQGNFQMCGLRWASVSVLKFLILAALVAAPCVAQDVSVETVAQKWNIHGQITETPQGDPPFRALYSGPNSLDNHGEIQETFTSDLYGAGRELDRS